MLVALRITSETMQQPHTVKDGSQLHEVLLDATEEAQRHNVLGAVFIEATNGSVTTMVVGGRDGPWL